MNQRFKTYALIWAILFAVFQVICFVTPGEMAGVSKFSGSFWIGYAIITIAFIGQLGCAYMALKTEDKTKVFYNIPIIRVSYIGLILTVIVGGVFMAVPTLPNWIGILLSVGILACTAIAVMVAKVDADAVKEIDNKIEEQTYFIKALTTEAENLLSRTKTAEAKAACKKVYEAARYSDPMSNSALVDVENQIVQKFKELTKAVLNGDDAIDGIADDVVALIGDRNKRCKLIK